MAINSPRQTLISMELNLSSCLLLCLPSWYDYDAKRVPFNRSTCKPDSDVTAVLSAELFTVSSVSLCYIVRIDFMPPPTIGGAGIIFSNRPSGCPAVRLLSANTYYLVEGFHKYSSRECCKGFQDQRWKVKVMATPNAIMAEACILTVWRRGSLVIYQFAVMNTT